MVPEGDSTRGTFARPMAAGSAWWSWAVDKRSSVKHHSPVDRGIWTRFQADGQNIFSESMSYPSFAYGFPIVSQGKGSMCLSHTELSVWERPDFRLVSSSFPLRLLHRLFFIFHSNLEHIRADSFPYLWYVTKSGVCVKYFLNTLSSSSYVST